MSKIVHDPRMATVADRFATWIWSLEYADLPPQVREKVKLSILDGLACAAYGSQLHVSVLTRAALLGDSAGRSGQAGIWGTHIFASPLEAAWLNGTAVHAFELDDFNTAGSLHGTSVMLPACLAIAQSDVPVSGKDLVVSLVAGWEIGVRLSRSLSFEESLLARGWHTPSLLGSISAAAAAGRILGLTIEELSHAISLAALNAAGLAVVQFEANAKRLYAGRAAQAGAGAALLAKAGITAPKDTFENALGGFLRAVSHGRAVAAQELDPPLDLNSLAADTIISKRYSSCGAIHPALDAIQELRDRHKSLSPSTVDSIHMTVAHQAYIHCGWEYVPRDATTAQFNLAYNVAVLIIEGEVGVSQFRNSLLSDEDVMRLVSRITISHDPTLDGLPIEARNAARVVVTLIDGQRLHAAADTAASASRTEIQQKLWSLTRDLLSTSARIKLFETCIGLESVSDISVIPHLVNTAADDNDEDEDEDEATS